MHEGAKSSLGHAFEVFNTNVMHHFLLQATRSLPRPVASEPD